jgi:hypothetical protein
MQEKLFNKKRESEPTPDQISRSSTPSRYRGSNQEQTGTCIRILSLFVITNIFAFHQVVGLQLLVCIINGKNSTLKWLCIEESP